MSNKTTLQGAKVENVTSQYGLSQLLNEPTHILENPSSGIDHSYNATKLGIKLGCSFFHT